MEHRRLLALWPLTLLGIIALHWAPSGVRSPGWAPSRAWAREVKPMSINRVSLEPRSIVQLLDAFLDRRFDLATAELVFGKVIEATNPDRLLLEGTSPPGARSVDVLLMDLPQGRTVMQVSVWLKELKPIDLGAMAQLLGPARTLPRLHPEDPVTYVYDRKGKDLDGMLQLGIVQDAPGQPQLTWLSVVRLLSP